MTLRCAALLAVRCGLGVRRHNSGPDEGDSSGVGVQGPVIRNTPIISNPMAVKIRFTRLYLHLRLQAREKKLGTHQTLLTK